MFEQVPVWLLCLFVLAIVSVSVRAGTYIAGRMARGQDVDEIANEGIGAVVGAMLGLLAFMLAFAFGMAASRRDARKDLLLAEINSIGTTFLRTGLIPGPQRSASRALLRKYVDLRLDAAENPERIQQAIAEATTIQGKLWAQAESLAEADLKHPDIVSLYIDSLNETIDLQTSRVIVGGYRVPPVVWVTFGILMILSSLAVGVHFGLKSSKPNGLMTAMLAVSFATVLFLIFDLDRSNQGWMKVDQKPMYDLRRQFGEEKS
jgi:hypothetical protein